jgi:hypothetical protein
MCLSKKDGSYVMPKTLGGRRSQVGLKVVRNLLMLCGFLNSSLTVIKPTPNPITPDETRICEIGREC